MLNLDLQGVAAAGDPLAAGAYNVIVEKAEVAPTKTGGQMIKVQLKVLDGPSTGRMIFDQFNIQNSNPQAVQIGLGQLKGMMKAFGHPNPNMLQTTQELIGLKGTAVLKIENDPQYGEQARVKGYKALAGTAPAAAGQAAPQAPAAGANPF